MQDKLLLSLFLYCYDLTLNQGPSQPSWCPPRLSTHSHACDHEIYTLMVYPPYLNVMRSRGISLKSNMWHFQFSIWLKSSLREVHFAEKPHLNQTSGSKVKAIYWKILKIEKQKKCIPFSGFISQSMLPTSDWLC